MRVCNLTALAVPTRSETRLNFGIQVQCTQQDAQTVVKTINRKLLGWSNYFCLGPVSKAYRAIDQHSTRRLRRWLSAKHKVRAGRIRRYSDEILHAEYGLIKLSQRTADFPWAKA
jgi:hypothetical protein